jgi:glycosyltransferase involved in cell wall biosynthesis
MPGVDPAQFAPGVVNGDAVRARIGINATTPLVSLIGRFQHVKGQDIFLDMVRRVAAELPAARFGLSGDNVFGVTADEQFKRRIVKTVEIDPILRERVTFLGFWPDSREVIAASDVIVCSSRFESLGMAVIEAMAMGRPVVSTRVGGPSETVRDGETGYLVDSGDAEAFAQRVLTLLVDSDLRAQIGAAARRHVESALTIHRYADQFVSLIEHGLML